MVRSFQFLNWIDLKLNCEILFSNTSPYCPKENTLVSEWEILNRSEAIENQIFRAHQTRIFLQNIIFWLIFTAFCFISIELQEFSYLIFDTFVYTIKSGKIVARESFPKYRKRMSFRVFGAVQWFLILWLTFQYFSMIFPSCIIKLEHISFRICVGAEKNSPLWIRIICCLSGLKALKHFSSED